MTEKKITPKSAEQDKDKARSEKADPEDKADRKKVTRKTGRYARWSDRNLKDNVVPVGW
jgi:hypothetical protein